MGGTLRETTRRDKPGRRQRLGHALPSSFRLMQAAGPERGTTMTGSNHTIAGAGRRSLLQTLAAGTVAALLHRTARIARAQDAPTPRPSPATPDAALAALEEGNRRFVEQRPRVRDTAEIEHTSHAVGEPREAGAIGEKVLCEKVRPD